MTEVEQSPEPSQPKRRLKHTLFRLVFLLVLLLPAECGARLSWSLRGVPFLTAPRTIYRSFYPGVAEVERQPPEPADADSIDILMLGGSVLHTDFCRVRINQS